MVVERRVLVPTRFVTLEGNEVGQMELVNPLLDVLRISYEHTKKGSYLGDEVNLKGVTRFHSLVTEESRRVVAVTSYKGSRMYTLGVDPEFQGGPYAKQLLHQALEFNPQTWMTAFFDAPAMLGTLSSEGMNLELVRDLEEMSDLFSSSPAFIRGDRVRVGYISNPRLAGRLGLATNEPLKVMTHLKSNHGFEYKQYVFKLR